VLEGAGTPAEDEAVERTAEERDECQGEEEDEFEGEAEGEGGVDGGFGGLSELFYGVGAVGNDDTSVGDELREASMN
jgi:hypothetical protein